MAATLPSRSIARRVLNPPLLAFAVVVVVVDDAFRAVVVPAVQALSRLHVVRRIEAIVASLPPYATLALFVIPLAIIEPLKVYALYLLGQGQIGSFVLLFVVAKVVGLGLAERLFAISRQKLLSIPWFARSYHRVVAVRDRVHAWLESWPLWQTAKDLVRRARDEARRAWSAAAKLLSGAGRGRLAAARRRARRRRACARK